MQRTSLLAGSLAVLAALCGSASAQTPAPRDIPEGFVLPGPAPTGGDMPKPAPTHPANPALAAPEHHSSTEWPCMQRRVAQMDAAQIWPDFPDGERSVARDGNLHNLVREVAQRRIPLAEGQERLKTYLADIPEDKRSDVAQALFLDLLTTLNRERADIIRGITRYAGKQKALAERIRKQTAEFDQLMSQPMPDQTKVAQEQEALLWQTRVFDDRRKSLTYVCEVPVLIEQRMFALGRTLRAAAEL